MSDESSTTMEEYFEPTKASFSLSNVKVGYTNEEKAFFHGMKAVRRLAEAEAYDEAAQIAQVLGDWWDEQEGQDDE